MLRLPIQGINVIVLFAMIFWLVKDKIHWNRVTAMVGIWISLMLFYLSLYIVFNKRFIGFTDLSDYIRWLVWLVSIIFFYEAFHKLGFKQGILQVYIITFVFAVAKKIIEAGLFETESLSGGDTAS